MITFMALVLYVVAGLCAYIAGASGQAGDGQTSGAAVVAFWGFFAIASSLIIWG